MAKIFRIWLRYMGHDFSISEAALLCWKWLKNLTNGLNMWEMTYIFGKGLKYFRKTALLCWKWFKNLTNCLNMW